MTACCMEQTVRDCRVITHDMVTREGLAQALEVRVSRGGLSKPAALQIAANLLRNNAIDVYSLSLPKYVV